MAGQFIDMLKNEFKLNETDSSLLGKTMRQLNRADRRYYYGHIKPREKSFKDLLQHCYRSLDPVGKKQWLDTVVQSMLDRGGEPDISDALVMKVIGHLTVYNTMRTKCEQEGIRINPLVNFGGMSAVITLVVIITAIIILYILNR